MKTPEEIKSGLECCAQRSNCEECPYHDHNMAMRGYDGPMCINRLLGDTLAYHRQLVTNKGQLLTRCKQTPSPAQCWISVEEWLPDDDIQYLTYTTARECVVCYYNGDGDWISDWASNDSPDVTHWMPLPEPPEEN